MQVPHLTSGSSPAGTAQFGHCFSGICCQKVREGKLKTGEQIKVGWLVGKEKKLEKRRGQGAAREGKNSVGWGNDMFSPLMKDIHILGSEAP